MKTLQIFAILSFLIVTDQLYSQDDKIASSLKGYPARFSGSIVEKVFPSNETNSTYFIKIYLPVTYKDSQKKYPMMILTDASWSMGIAQTTFDYMTLTKEIPEVIVVGIGYPDSSSLNFIRNRYRDMLSTHVEGYEPSGSAEKFIAFIEKELMPYIESNYRVDTKDKCYFGHSFGGLLGSHILLEHSDLFNRYIIGSPSYWWNNKEIIKRLSVKEFNLSDSIRSCYTFIGGKEAKFMIAQFNEFNDLLVSRLTKIVSYHSQIFADETHVSVTPAAFSTAIKFTYKDQ